MKNKLFLYGATITATLTGLVMAATTHAAVLFAVPTSTAPSLTANVGDQLGDTGTLAVIGVVAGIYLVFYVISQLISLVPKKGGRRS
jgi:hypothetical protein